MSFQPIVPLTGYGGWRFLERTLEPQQAAFAKSQPVQRELSQFSANSQKENRQRVRYVSQLEMMSFLSDIEQMCGDVDCSAFWQDLKVLKDRVLEQQCATEKEVLCLFKIRAKVERAKEENERFFDAYPVSTDAWENGHFDVNGEIFD